MEKDGEEMENEPEEYAREAQEHQILRDPGIPTSSELANTLSHTHIPFRTWCSHSVSGRARHPGDYRRSGDRKYTIPHIVCDCCFLRSDLDDENILVQVAKDIQTGYLFGYVLPTTRVSALPRGRSHGGRNLSSRIRPDRAEGGNEPAIQSLREEVQRRQSKLTVLENSKVGQSSSNGVAERSVQALSEQIRIMRSCLQDHLKVGIPSKHLAIAWLIKHAGELISPFQLGPDGRTAYERAHGKPFRHSLVEVGEREYTIEFTSWTPSTNSNHDGQKAFFRVELEVGRVIARHVRGGGEEYSDSEDYRRRDGRQRRLSRSELSRGSITVRRRSNMDVKLNDCRKKHVRNQNKNQFCLQDEYYA